MSSPPRPSGSGNGSRSAALYDSLLSRLGSDGADPKLLAYRASPLAFIEERLRVNLWERQEAVIRTAWATKQTAVKSGHGVGKTHTAACAALTFLYTHTPSLVLTTAPSARQVEQLLWGEIRSLVLKSYQTANPLPGRLLMTRLEASRDQRAIGFSAREPERAAGFHCENTLVIVDEASGVARALFETLQGVLTSANCHLLLIGNPTIPAGAFFDAFSSTEWSPLTVSCLDSPNVAAARAGLPLPYPGLVTLDWCAEREREWGADSDPYRIRVLGQFPKQSPDSLV